MLRIALLAIALATLGSFALVDDPNRAHPVSAEKAGIGRSYGHLEFTALVNRTIRLDEFAKGKPVVIALTGTTCPLAKKFGPTLGALEDRFAKQGVGFIFVNPAESESGADVHTSIKQLGLAGPYIHDEMAAAALGAKTTTEVFLLDASRKLVYRGAVDDQYGIGYSTDKPKNTYLVDAIEATLKGKTPSVQATWAPGCVLATPVAESKAKTYYGRIAKIVQDRCIECHRPGGVAPFSLETYNDVKSRAPMIKYAVEKGIMPPWFAAKGTGPWKNDKSLSEAEKADLFAWIDGGTPEGDPNEAPAPKKFSSAWSIGEPDKIVRIAKPIPVKATGVMAYQNVTVPMGLDEDTWVQKLEVRPSARQVVHHVLIFLREKGAEGRNDPGEEISGFFAAYVPGTSTLIYPDGYGKKIPAGASLRFQIHYTPNGTATQDQTELGLVFSKVPVTQEVHTIGIANLLLNIPPGASRHPVSAQIPVPYDVKVLSLIPHMHVRGAGARYDVIKPDGSRSTLLDVPNYDFNWQLAYDFREPRAIAKGSRVEFTAWYDNSDKNPANPDPTKTVRWGLQTYDEMHLGYVEYIVPGAKPGEPLPRMRRGFGGANAIVEAVFKQLDKNADGFVTSEEAGNAWNRLKAADENGDGKLSLDEAMKQFGG